MPVSKPTAIDSMLAAIDEAFDRRSWHGTNLKGSIRGLSAANAEWRPGPGRKSVADVVVHCAYWKYIVRRKLRNEPKGSFSLAGSNWFALESPLSEAAWKGYVKLLVEQHRALRATVAELDLADVERKPPGSKVTRGMFVRGVAAHDVYHAGQIQVLKALRKNAARD